MKVTRGDTVDRQTVLHIEVDGQQIDKHIDRAYRKVVQRANIPGFRKGKAPRSIVERFVGREYLLEEALESLVPEAVKDAIEEQEIEAAATPRVSIVEREPVVKLDATVALPPLATLGDYQSISIDEEAEPVTDEQVDEAIERVRESQATWEPVERPMKLGDLVTITVTGMVGNEKFADAEDAEYLAEAGTENPVPGFAEKLEGINAGETREFTLTIPEEFANSEFAGKEADFTVTASAIKEKVLPAADDELAKSLGEGFESIDDLRNKVRVNLEASAADSLRRSLEEKVVDALVEGAQFEVSPILIEHEAEHILSDQQNSLAQYNISFEQYMQGVGKSTEDVVNEAKEAAVLRLRRSLVIDEIAKAEGVDVTDDEINAEIERLKSEQSGDTANLETDEAREAVRRILRRRVAVDRAIEIAQQAPKLSSGKKTTETDTQAEEPVAEPKRSSSESAAGSETDSAETTNDPAEGPESEDDSK
ncbi:MAG: trigger factor [Dehalococcoidia bacterium]